MSEFVHAARVISALVLVLVAISPATAAQSESTPRVELPTITGRVVRDPDGSSVVGAFVDARPAYRSHEETRTDGHGRFARVGLPKDSPTKQPPREPYDFVESLTISGSGTARTRVDPCADTPWSAPIRVRATASLRGRVVREPERRGHRVTVEADGRDLCWPPRSGLPRTVETWVANLDAEGGFEFRELPAEIALRVAWSTDGTDAHRSTTPLALAPGESRVFEIDSAADARAERVDTRTSEASGPWIPVYPELEAEPDAVPFLTAFEIVEGGRFAKHARAHHQPADFRACNHLEALAGIRTLVAFDAHGRFGMKTIDVGASAASVTARIPLARGALLRIAFDGPEERARVALVSSGVEYAARDLPRGVVWYELAPPGKVTIRVTSTAAEPHTVELDARAGSIERVALDRPR